jgi:hypothetical protein
VLYSCCHHSSSHDDDDDDNGVNFVVVDHDDGDNKLVKIL